MLTAYDQAIDDINQNIAAHPDINVKYQLHEISVKSDTRDGSNNQVFIDSMNLTNYNNAQYGVLACQGFAYNAAGVNIGRNPKTDFGSSRNDRDVGLYLDNFLNPGQFVSEIAHIIIQVTSGYPLPGNSSLTYQKITMAYIGFVPNYSRNYTPLVPCFVKGSPILTPAGYKAVETICNGDLVTTSDGRSVPVSIYSTRVTATKATAPYRIPARTFGAYPKTDIQLSPQHAFSIGKGLWHIPLVAAERYPAIRQYDIGKEMIYYHLECPDYFRDNLMYNGTVVESFANKQLTSFKALVYTWNATKAAYTRCSKGAVRASAMV